jgi:hypothetical protein
MIETTAESQPGRVNAQKQQLLLAFYQIAWDEMTWRRNAGYRTIILGLGYCGAILTVIAYNHAMPPAVRVCLAAVIGLATLFGGGYLASNYRKYMAAAARLVVIEKTVGAFDADFLGEHGALMPAVRHDWPKVALSKDPVCLWSVIAFVAGGLVTTVAILLM